MQRFANPMDVCGLPASTPPGGQAGCRERLHQESRLREKSTPSQTCRGWRAAELILVRREIGQVQLDEVEAGDLGI